MLVLKVLYNGALRRHTFLTTPSLADVQARVRVLFCVPPLAAIALTCPDEDGDRLALYHDEDWSMVLKEYGVQNVDGSKTVVRLVLSVEDAAVVAADSVSPPVAVQGVRDAEPQESIQPSQSTPRSPSPPRQHAPSAAASLQGLSRDTLAVFAQIGHIFQAELNDIQARITAANAAAPLDTYTATAEREIRRLVTQVAETATVVAANVVHVGEKARVVAVEQAKVAVEQAREALNVPPPVSTGDSAAAPRTHVDVRCDICSGPVIGVRWKCARCRDYDMCERCHMDRRSEHSSQHEFHRIESPAVDSGIQQASNDPPARLSGLRRRCSRTSRHSGRLQHCNAIPDFVSSSETAHRSRANTVPDAVAPAIAANGITFGARHAANCDYCDSTIIGTRYKCAHCPDFDLCRTCFALADSQHAGHSFIAISRPSFFIRNGAKSSSQDAVHENVHCDGGHCSLTQPIHGDRYKCVVCQDYDLCASCEALPGIVDAHFGGDHVFIKIRRPGTWDKSRANANGVVDEKVAADAPVPRCDAQPAANAPVSLRDAQPAAQAPASIAHPRLPKARFVQDMTIPDGTNITAGDRFVKCWLVRNTGTEAWPEGTLVEWTDGDMMVPKELVPQATSLFPIVQFHVSAAQPGESVSVEAEMCAGNALGRFTSYWRLLTPDGNSFGDNLWCTIEIIPNSADNRGPDLSSSSLAASSTLMFPTISVSHSLQNMDCDQTSVATSAVASDINANAVAHHAMGQTLFPRVASSGSQSRAGSHVSYAAPQQSWDAEYDMMDEWRGEQQ